MANIIGYARTSTADQTAGLEDQVRILTEQGCDRIYSEHISASSAKRPELAACLGYLRDGETWVFTKPDRLARSVTDMLKIDDDLKKRGVGLRVLSLGIDTSTPTGRLVLTNLSAIAEWERAIMLERQKVGIVAAKAAGKYTGRKPVLTREQTEWAIDELKKMRRGAKRSARRLEICLELDCSLRSLYTAMKLSQEGPKSTKRKKGN